MGNDMYIIEAIKGDKESLVEVIVQEKKSYYKLAYVYMKNEHDAMDAVEDMILVLYQNIHKLRKPESFRSWSMKILVNICKKNLKRKKENITLEDIYEGENVFEDLEGRLMVQNAVKKLKPKYIEVIKLRYYLDMSYEEMAEVLGIPKGTVKSRLFNGLKKLKKEIGGGINEENYEIAGRKEW